MRSNSIRRVAALLCVAFAGAAACLLTGCVSARYQLVKGEPSPARALNVGFPPGRLEATLDTVIIYNGPGSWKRQAFWDEYVIALHNPGSEPLTIVSVSLEDSARLSRPAGDDPWVLERDSKTLEKRYQDTGVAFARMAAPRVLVGAAEPVVVAGVGAGAVAAAVIATATVVGLPIYGLVVWDINHHNKAHVMAEFTRRRLPLPLSLGPGETRTGSVFFAVVPNPRSLGVHWTHESAGGETALGLEFLRGLHMKNAAADSETDDSSTR